MVTDVQEACDLLDPYTRPLTVWMASSALRSRPIWLTDAEGTMEEARHLFQMVNRRNLFSKIPGTRDGVSAVEEMLYEGVNVNITLLFSSRVTKRSQRRT